MQRGLVGAVRILDLKSLRVTLEFLLGLFNVSKKTDTKKEEHQSHHYFHHPRCFLEVL
jgi:hypothetical protein